MISAADWAKLVQRATSGRAAYQGLCANRNALSVLVETSGYPRLVELAYRPIRSEHALRDFAERLWKACDGLGRRDHYARRDAFPLCLRHVGYCPRCHGS